MCPRVTIRPIMGLLRMNNESDGDKSVSCLEADVAFFDARLMLVQEPETRHQQAQIKAYETLRRIFLSQLAERRELSRIAQ